MARPDEDETRKATPKSGAAETSRLRDDIDRGGTGDKVAFTDPAAAPLGTDAEAGGTSPTREEARTARAHETRRGEAESAKLTPSDLQASSTKQKFGAGTVALLVAACIIILLFVFY